jgi:transcriptional regulator with XRE-family HTH domain
MQLPTLPMSDRRTISRRIRLARANSGMSQAELGEITHRSQSVISRIESAKQSIEAEDVVAFSQALGVDTHFFIDPNVDLNQLFGVD